MWYNKVTKGGEMDSKAIKNYIIANGKTEFILSSLGVERITEHHNYFSAPMPDGDNKNGIVIYKDDLGFKSYSRGLNGDIFTLIEYINHTDFRGALNWICGLLDIDSSLTPAPPKKDILSVFTKHLCRSQDTIDIELPKDAFDNMLDMEHISLLREGITPQAFARFGCMYNYSSQRIVYVWRRWFDGKAVGTNQRTTNEAWQELGINKFVFSKGFNKGTNLYGLWENYNNIKRKGEVVVFEAEKSVLKRASQLDYTAVALGGKAVSDEQVRILLSLNVDIVLAFDQDVGAEHIKEVAERLNKYRNVYVIDSSTLENKMSPADLSESEYKRLYKNKKSA